MATPAFIQGIGLATPPFVVEQSDLGRRYAAVLEGWGADRATRRRIEMLFARSPVETRRFAISDFAHDRALTLYGGSAPPSTGRRLEEYARVAPKLAAEACMRAIENAGIDVCDVGVLVVASCTGIGAPDLDVELVERLGLPASVERSTLVWMSCSASFPALRVARNAIAAKPGKYALVACVEVCSAHVQADSELESAIAHTLFADGSSALVIGGDESSALATLGTGTTRLITAGREALQWRFTDSGFRAHIGDELPDLVQAHTAGVVKDALIDVDGRVSSWCVHPGGSKILDAVASGCHLDDRALDSSRSILTSLGNLSSATIWYVLARELPRLPAGAAGLLLGFGVGLTIEALPFRCGSRSLRT